MWVWIIGIGIVLIVFSVILVLLLRKSPPSSTFFEPTVSVPRSSVSTPSREYYSPANFQVFNYLPNHSLRIDVLDQDSGDQVVVADVVKPLKTRGIPKETIERYFKPGNVIRIYISEGSETAECSSQHYTDHILDMSCYERIKNLHVGMVTTRFIGKSTDGLRMTTVADNAIQGHAWLMIHNLTEIPLRLNDDIVVAPHSTERYLGYLHQGVTLGTIFKDQDGIYPDFQYLHPDSDLYYGVVSDLRQPLYGPFQLEFSDDCDPDQTLWPFELGQM